MIWLTPEIPLFTIFYSVSALKLALEKYSSIGRDQQLLLNEQGEVLQDTMFVTTTTNNTKTHMYLYNKNQPFVPADFEQIPVTCKSGVS